MKKKNVWRENAKAKRFFVNFIVKLYVKMLLIIDGGRFDLVKLIDFGIEWQLLLDGMETVYVFKDTLL